jgi:hypothetical protein
MTRLALSCSTAFTALGGWPHNVMARAVPKRSGPGNLIVSGNRRVAVPNLAPFDVGDRIKLGGHPDGTEMSFEVIGID